MSFLFSILFLFAITQAQDAEIFVQKEQTRQILRTRLCGQCHIPPGNSKALKIFNLDDNDWVSHLTERQLSQFKWRIQLRGDAEIKEMHGNPQIHRFSKTEIARVIRYIDLEIANRDPLKNILFKD